MIFIQFSWCCFFLPPHYSQQQSDSIFLNFVPKFYPRHLLSLIRGSLFGRAPIDQIAFKKASMPSVKSGQLYKLGLKIFSRKTLARETLVRLSAAVRKASPRSSLEDRTREMELIEPMKTLLANEIRAHAQRDSINTALNL